MSGYGENEVHQLMEAMKGAGYTPAHLEKLKRRKKLLHILEFLEDKAKIELLSDKTRKFPWRFVISRKIHLSWQYVGNVRRDIFTVTSEGLTQEQLIKQIWHLKLSADARELFKEIVTTKDVVYEPRVILATDLEHLELNGDQPVRHIARRMGLLTPPLELAALVANMCRGGVNPYDLFGIDRDAKNLYTIPANGTRTGWFDRSCGFVFLADTNSQEFLAR